MGSADLRDVNGNHQGDPASDALVPPAVTSQDELERAAADAVRPDLTDVEAVLRSVAELTGMPLTPVDRNGPAVSSVLRRQPVRIVEGSIEGGYANVREVICCGCGDNPLSGLLRGLGPISAAPRAVPVAPGPHSV
jgi:hypothetical protein